MILQEGFEDKAMNYIMAYVDPLVYTFWGIAITLFVINTYKKPELRAFYLTFAFIFLGGMMMMMGLLQLEAAFILIAGASSIFAIYNYRIKTKKMEV